LIEACDDLGLAYALAAPTGKAAKRLGAVRKTPGAELCTGFSDSTARRSQKVPEEKLDIDFPGNRRGLDGGRPADVPAVPAVA